MLQLNIRTHDISYSRHEGIGDIVIDKVVRSDSCDVTVLFIQFLLYVLEFDIVEVCLHFEVELLLLINYHLEERLLQGGLSLRLEEELTEEVLFLLSRHYYGSQTGIGSTTIKSLYSCGCIDVIQHFLVCLYFLVYFS